MSENAKSFIENGSASYNRFSQKVQRDGWEGREGR